MNDNIISNTLLKMKNIAKDIDLNYIAEDSGKLDIEKSGLAKSLIESTLFTMLVIVLFYVLPFTRERFLLLNVHPLLIVVGFITMKYGAYDGIAASFIATFGYLTVFLISGHSLTEFATKFEYYKFFIIFLMTAILLGKYQEYYRTREDRLAVENAGLQNNLKEAREEYDQLMNINNSLKSQVQQGKGGIIAFQNMKKILSTKFTVSEVYEEAIIMMHQFLNCEVSGIYQVEKGKIQLKSYNFGVGIGNGNVGMQREKSRLVRVAKIGNSLMEDELELSRTEAPRFLEVMTRKIPLEYPVDLEGKLPIYIAPLIVRDEVIAFVEVERLSYDAAKTQNFEIFRVIVEEINNRLEIIF